MELAIYLLRFSAALTMVSYGINQLANPQGWLSYVPAGIQRMLPEKPTTFMRTHALGNLVFGIWLASGLFPFVAAVVAAIWWLTILPFAFKVKWDIGMRDLTITAGLVALAALLH